MRIVQIAAVLLLIAVVYAAHSGGYAFAAMMTADFNFGFMVGVAVTILGGLLLHWIDKRTSDNR